jgi:hypothetical protein
MNPCATPTDSSPRLAAAVAGAGSAAGVGSADWRRS